jgi:hypothetical protein
MAITGGARVDNDGACLLPSTPVLDATTTNTPTTTLAAMTTQTKTTINKHGQHAMQLGPRH